GAHRDLDIRLARHHHHGRRHRRALQIFEQADPIAAGHDNVGENQIITFRFREFESPGSIVANGSFVSRKAERTRDGRERICVVVDDQKMCFWRQRVFSRQLPTAILGGSTGGAGTSSSASSGSAGLCILDLGGWTGSSSEKVVPVPGTLSTEILPP